MKKRLCIFSFYDKEGIVDDYILTLLHDLKININRLVIIVNGDLSTDSEHKLQNYSNEIYIRDNTGYDAGAYKDVLINKLQDKEISVYDEIVLCNDTFFGPFTSFCNIFAEMESRDCDFWGLNGYFNVLFSHIQSYFMVFKKSIISNNLLREYFENNVNEKTMNINDIYCQFETGLFDFLTRQSGMKYDVYTRPSDYDVYRLSYLCMKEYGLPIVKKKIFAKPQDDVENLWCTLSYVKYRTNYDIDLILKYIDRVYNVKISSEEIAPIDKYKLPLAFHVPVPLVKEEEIENFLSNKEFYIYGAGMYASKVYWRFGRQNKRFKGFIVSDEAKNNNKELFGMPVIKFGEIEQIEKKRIILGVSSDYAGEIVEKFQTTYNLLRIF